MNNILEELQTLIENEKDENLKKAMQLSMIQLKTINKYMELRQNGTTTKDQRN